MYSLKNKAIYYYYTCHFVFTQCFQYVNIIHPGVSQCENNASLRCKVKVTAVKEVGVIGMCVLMFLICLFL